MYGFSNEAYYLFISAFANRTRLAIIDVLNEGPKNISEVSCALEQEEAIVLETSNCLNVLHYCAQKVPKKRRFTL